MGDRRLDREAQYWKLTSGLLLTVAALVVAALGLPELSTGLLMAAIPVAISALMLIRSQRALVEDLQAELQRQLPIDSDTGATTYLWFQRMLEQECRRAMREFSPVSVMRLLPVSAGMDLHQRTLIEALQKRMTRPGDLVALDQANGLWLLLPATNEAVSGFAERVFQLVNQHVENVHLVCYTFQPTADLNQTKVIETFTQLEVEMGDETQAKLRCESEGFDMPSVTYSL
ncbi:MAG TPA: hypothetical protein VLA39_13185 [Marinobacterium sp.]|nr:hypothetical protein [Marinobacterium sp.]